MRFFIFIVFMYKYECVSCGFYTSNKTDYTRHLSRPKHLTIQSNLGNSKNFSCHCGKVYLHQSSYSRHSIKCNPKITSVDSITESLCLEVIKNNKEFCQEMMKQQNEILSKAMEQQAGAIIKLAEHQNNVSNNMSNSHNNSHNNNNNSHNKVFNLQFFLNEQCKDAMNITDFVNNLKISIADLEETGRLGYVDGISKIIIDNLRQLDTYKRPIHCSDIKREVFYIRDDDKWHKEKDELITMKKFVKIVGIKNIQQISEWLKLYPEAIQSDSRKNNMYHKITDSSMSGETEDEQSKNVNKIIKNIANEVIIDKLC
jgi:hypothetical protein